MKRIEEIMQQAEITVFPLDDVREQVKFEEGFIEGAKWADMTMIEKATQWFKDSFYNGGMHLLEEPNGGYREAYNICCSFESIQEMVIDFLNAMEE